MYRLTFSFVLLVICGWMIGVPAFGSHPAEDESQIQDLIYLGPKSPIFVRLRIRIDGKGLSSLRERYALQLFDKLDTSGDGALTEGEVTAIPPIGHLMRVSTSNANSSAPNIGAADADQNGQVTRNEFTAYIVAASGAQFHINTEIQQPTDTQPVELFGRLDRNDDECLDSSELSQAVRRLRLMDSDFDDRITADEIRTPDSILGLQQTVDTDAAQVSASLALLVPIHHQYVDEALIRRVIQLYDKLARGANSRRFTKDGQLSAAEMGQPADVTEIHDVNGDKRLDQQELGSLLTNPPATHEVMINFGQEFSNRHVELLRKNPLTSPALLDISTRKDGCVLITLGDTTFELAVDPKVGPVDAAGLFGLFRNGDQDKNDYLDRNEFRQLSGTGENHFPHVDTDGDGMIVETEYTSFVNQQSELQKHVVSLNLAGNDRSLFEIVDVARDGLLESGELDSLPSRIGELDSDRDGNLKREELSGSLRMVMARGLTNTARRNNILASTIFGGMQRPQITGKGNWFAGMDRNNDGKVSKREFLGPVEVFRQLDSDQNRSLDATEAKLESIE
jgi:hypothetical protein